MILSDADILRRLEAGDLVVEPLDDPDIQIQPASVDLRLGREFLEFQRTNISCIHPDSEQEVEEYVDETHVEEDGEFILHPGDFVLGTTRERVEIPPDLIAHVEGRSSLGRLAIVVHASLPSDEEVFLWTPADGFGFHEIGEIVENERPARAVAFDPETLSVRTHRVTDYITNPAKRIYRITLESGRAVHVTRDHNLFTLGEDAGVRRIASEDAEGRRVMVPKRLPASPSERRTIDGRDRLDPAATAGYVTDGAGQVVAGGTAGEVPVTREFGWLLGVYVAAGSVEDGQIRVATDDRAVLDRVADCFAERDVSTSVRERDGTARLTVRSARWSALVRGLAGVGEEKTIPESVFEWPEAALAGLLEGLLDGDGPEGDEGDRREVFDAGDEDLANRVLYLAARLGVAGSISGIESGQHADPESGTWFVDVSDEGHESDRLPVPGAYLEDCRERAGLTAGEAAEATGFASPSRISAIENGDIESVTRETLERYRDAYGEAGVGTTRLDQLLDGGVRFEAVVAVEQTDRVEPTYDLEVQPGGQPIENFLGGRGGVFLSNTAGLCDPGYQGQITLELSNLGTAPVALTPGMRISQLTFTELKNPAERPYGAERGSKYQGQEGPQASKIQGDREFGGEQ